MDTHRWILTHMITVLGITVSLVHLLLTLTPDAHAESFNIKPGAWEMSVTTVTSGMKLSPELSAKMAPAQRAHMEQMMKAREGKPHTMTTRSCITQEDLSQDRIIKEMEDEDEDTAVQCKVKVLSKSSTNYAQALPPPPRTSWLRRRHLKASWHSEIEERPDPASPISTSKESGSARAVMDWMSRD